MDCCLPKRHKNKIMPEFKCPICLCECVPFTNLHCGHSVCDICLNTILSTIKYPNKCPICKKNILIKNIKTSMIHVQQGMYELFDTLFKSP